MDKRMALVQDYLLEVKNGNNGKQVYKIKSEVARGGSCIVYDATYLNNSGIERFVRIKECYPFKVNATRTATGLLSVSENDKILFEEYKTRFCKAFDVMNELFNAEELTNTTANSYDIYAENNTFYVVSVYTQGCTLSQCENLSLKESISVVKAVAKTVREIHQRGYLYLDIKPDNVWILRGTTELVQLFDFDSMIPFVTGTSRLDMSDYRISFTKGFAAYELQRGEIERVGIYTDIYAIGALLFFSVFGHAPNALERDLYAEYDYTTSIYANKRYQDKLYFRLTEFFHATLSDFYPDRYNDMDIVLSKLEELFLLADEKRTFVFSSNNTYAKKILGREEEILFLSKWLENPDKYELYVTGFGGIGKSSLVRTFISDKCKQVDACVYLDYKGDIRRTIIDDTQLLINSVERDPGEDEQDYFIRKMSVIRQIAQKEKLLLVIDNYLGEPCEELRVLCNANCKLIFITRREHIYGTQELNIKSIENKDSVRSIFNYYVDRVLSEEELRNVDLISEIVAGHTLVLELIAKQLSSSRLTLLEATRLVHENGFTHLGEERIRYAKDDVSFYATISNIINAIFDSSDMSYEKRAVLKALALFGTSGVDIKAFAEIVELQNLDIINELFYDGWIEIYGEKLTVHPVICEVIHSWVQDNAIDKIALRVMNHVFKVIRLENHREDYSKKLLKVNQVMQDAYNKNKWYRDWYTRSKFSQGVLGEIVLERLKRGEDYTVTDHELIKLYLDYAEQIILSSQREKGLRSADIYKDLLYETIIAMPCDREDFVLNRSEELMKYEKVNNSIAMMQLFKLRVCIYCERKDFSAAWLEIENSQKYLKRYRCNYSMGQFYDILAGYYGSLLNGAYETENEEKREYLDLLVDSLNKSIRYTKRSHRHSRKELQLVKLLLFKANVLIRSELGTVKEIEKILANVQSLLAIHCQANSTYVKDYYMTCAWYMARVFKTYKFTTVSAMKAAEIAAKTATSELQVIDEIIIPYVNMLLELGQYERTLEWLNVGLKFCEEYTCVIPYIRKKMQLYYCLLDVYNIMKDYSNCSRTIAMLDELRSEYPMLNIDGCISDELRESNDTQN